MSRYERIEELVDDLCTECESGPANVYEDAETGDEVILCEDCAGDHPVCTLCGARGEIQISGGGTACRRCAAEEEGEV